MTSLREIFEATKSKQKFTASVIRPTEIKIAVRGDNEYTVIFSQAGVLKNVEAKNKASKEELEANRDEIVAVARKEFDRLFKSEDELSFRKKASDELRAIRKSQ